MSNEKTIPALLDAVHANNDTTLEFIRSIYSRVTKLGAFECPKGHSDIPGLKEDAPVTARLEYINDQAKKINEELRVMLTNLERLI